MCGNDCRTSGVTACIYCATDRIVQIRSQNIYLTEIYIYTYADIIYDVYLQIYIYIYIQTSYMIYIYGTYNNLPSNKMYLSKHKNSHIDCMQHTNEIITLYD